MEAISRPSLPLGEGLGRTFAAETKLRLTRLPLNVMTQTFCMIAPINNFRRGEIGISTGGRGKGLWEGRRVYRSHGTQL